MGYKRKYNALRNVPWEERARIRDCIGNMPDGKEKEILRLYFVDGRSPSEIILYCQERGIRSRNGTHYTTRSIQNICNKYFPEVRRYRRRNPDHERRAQHFKYISSNQKVRCGKCGSEERLEWHHMIPMSYGGETCEENMVCLCHECHKRVTNYHITLRNTQDKEE